MRSFASDNSEEKFSPPCERFSGKRRVSEWRTVHPWCPTASHPGLAGRENMHLTDTAKAEYIGIGAGAPRQNRGPPRRTSFFRIFCEMYSVNGNLRNFHDGTLATRTRPRRASSVLLMGISGPPLTTVGGAPFCRPGRAAAEVKPRVGGVKQTQPEEQT